MRFRRDVTQKTVLRRIDIPRSKGDVYAPFLRPNHDGQDAPIIINDEGKQFSAIADYLRH